VFVCSERDNDENTVSKNAVLRYFDSSNSTTLIATHQWDLTNDLPLVDENEGWLASWLIN